MVKNDSSLKVDHLMYSFVINGCCFNKNLEKAIEILMDSIKEGVKLNEETYNNVLEYLLSNKFMKNYERVQNCSMICKALKDKNYQINIDLYNRLMKLIYNPSESTAKKNNTGKKYK
jgi:pentatricopeptide repeat protein